MFLPPALLPETISFRVAFKLLPVHIDVRPSLMSFIILKYTGLCLEGRFSTKFIIFTCLRLSR